MVLRNFVYGFSDESWAAFTCIRKRRKDFTVYDEQTKQQRVTDTVLSALVYKINIRPFSLIIIIIIKHTATVVSVKFANESDHRLQSTVSIIHSDYIRLNAAFMGVNLFDYGQNDLTRDVQTVIVAARANVIDCKSLSCDSCSVFGPFLPKK